MVKASAAGILLGLAAAATACGPRPAAPAPAPRASAAPALDALPAVATIAWVRPSVLFASATSDDDESATLGAVRSMRLDVEAVLKGQQWRVTDADTAQYRATVALLKRTRIEQQRRVVAGTAPPLPRCDATRSGGSCPPAPPPRYQVVSVQVPETTALFIVDRRSDGARFQWTVEHLDAKLSGGAFAKQVITLLKAR